MAKITPKDFAHQIQRIIQEDENGHRDTESLHATLDDYLCETLESLGYDEGIKLFRAAPKWYA